MNAGKERLILTEPFSPTAAVSRGRGIDKNGNQIATAGARAYAVAYDDFTAADVAVSRKKLAGVTLGTAKGELGGTVAIGDPLTMDNQGRWVVATAGQEVSAEAREAGVVGDFIEIFKLAQRRQVASAANADTSGATLGQLETEVNELKAALRAHGILAP